MQIVQFRVDDNYLNIVLTLLDNLKLDIIKDLTIDKKRSSKSNKDDMLAKFIAVDNSIKSSDKAQEFLALGGSNCWSANLQEIREDRIDYGSR